jgi:hypothetical protein
MKRSEKNTKKDIEIYIEKLPPELQQEEYDFAQFLFLTKVKPKQKRLRLSWAGGLSEFLDKFTSLDLQKKPLNGGAIDVSR